MGKSEFSIDEKTGEILQHDGFIRLVIAKSLYALVERLANTEAMLVNTNAQLAVKDTMLGAEMENNRVMQSALEAQSEELAKARQLLKNVMDNMPESYDRGNLTLCNTSAWGAWVARKMIVSYFNSIEEKQASDADYDEFWSGEYTFPKPDDVTTRSALISMLAKALKSGWIEHVGDSDEKYRIKKNAPSYTYLAANKVNTPDAETVARMLMYRAMKGIEDKGLGLTEEQISDAFGNVSLGHFMKQDGATWGATWGTLVEYAKNLAMGEAYEDEPSDHTELLDDIPF